MFQICNWWISLIKNFDFSNMLLTSITNICGSFHWKRRWVFQTLMLSNKYQINVIANQTKYGKIKTANFTIDQWNHGCRVMIWKFIQHAMIGNLLFLEDVLIKMIFRHLHVTKKLITSGYNKWYQHFCAFDLL